MTVRVRLDTQRCRGNRGLGSSGAARKYLASRAMERCRRYVPVDTGRLRDSARLSPDGRTITYPVPYAASQFYGSWRHRDPLRGDRWHRRMLRREGRALLANMEAYFGRRRG